MIDEDRLALLEALLARVQSRSRARAPAVLADLAPIAPASLASLASPDAPGARGGAFDVPTPMAAFLPSPLPPAPPPPSAPSAPRQKYTSRPEVPAAFFAMRPPEPSQVRAIEPPPMEVVELEVDPDPSVPPTPISTSAPFDDFAPAFSDRSFPDRGSGQLPAEPALESRSRLVSAPPSAPDEPTEAPPPGELQEPLDVGDEPPGHVASDPTIEVAAAEVSRAELEALEEEQAPTSSRRPISMEEKMNELEDPIPLHAPPPESGRLPAASPTFELAFSDANVSVVRPEPEPRADVALFVGAAPAAAPAKTFGELLDEALSL